MMDKLKIAVSIKALFDMEEEDKIYRTEGLDAYIKYNEENEKVVLKQGTAFRLIKNLLALNTDEEQIVEVILMSRASVAVATRVYKSLKHYKININRAYFTSGDAISPYAISAGVDLYLSTTKTDVKNVLDAGIASGLIRPQKSNTENDGKGLRIAFDCDQVLFSDESDKVYQEEGLEKYIENEKKKINKPIEAGPFKDLFIKLGKIQERFETSNSNPIKIAICTARDFQTAQRALNTIKSWGVRIGQAFFLDGSDKSVVLEAYKADIFFDDSPKNINSTSKVVPSVQVLREETSNG
jgi:5'-nucleotidase